MAYQKGSFRPIKEFPLHIELRLEQTLNHAIALRVYLGKKKANRDWDDFMDLLLEMPDDVTVTPPTKVKIAKDKSWTGDAAGALASFITK